MHPIERGPKRPWAFLPTFALFGVAVSLFSLGNASIGFGQVADGKIDPGRYERARFESIEGTSSREAKQAAIRGIPFDLLTPDAATRLKSVLDDASYFRKMPSQTVECDPEMYVFLVRHPEVVVNIWDMMGITRVSLDRIGEYQLAGDDGAGTTCKMDLVYGSNTLHIYQSSGAYQGNLWARELRGKCVVMLHNRETTFSDGRPGTTAWMEAFMKLDNIGADLVVKTLGPLVSKTADHNFVECAAFFSQISQTARTNPHGLQQVGLRLQKVSPATRDEFMRISSAVAVRAHQAANETIETTPGIPTSSRRVLLPGEFAGQDEESTDSPTIRRMTRADESGSKR
jgi:hypothetical protein